MRCGWQQKLSAAAIPIWERITGNSEGGWRANRRSRLWRVTWRAYVYRLLTKGQEYVDKGAAHFVQKHKQREMANLQRKAAELGLKLVAAR